MHNKVIKEFIKDILSLVKEQTKEDYDYYKEQLQKHPEYIDEIKEQFKTILNQIVTDMTIEHLQVDIDDVIIVLEDLDIINMVENA
jgi:hypothetical protein